MIRSDLVMKWKTVIAISVLALSALCATPRLNGQAVSATLLGTVTHQSGAVIPQAKVTITEEKTGLNYTGETNASGNYQFPNLPPGVYDVRVAYSGFQTAESKAVEVTVNSSVRADMSLTPGSTAQQVVVQAQSAALQTGG